MDLGPATLVGGRYECVDVSVRAAIGVVLFMERGFFGLRSYTFWTCWVAQGHTGFLIAGLLRTFPAGALCDHPIAVLHATFPKII